MAVALRTSLVGFGLKVGALLDDHGGVHQQLRDAGQAISEAIFKKEIDAVTGEVIVCLSGHGLVLGLDLAPPFSSHGTFNSNMVAQRGR
ncbi:MAG: hypothetical protein HKP15_10975 [Akkermansiaceae bacterium]|nr:hypothetical protein [Akkermansiaceae bacterium]